MHDFLVNVTLLLNRHCHSSDNIILETYTLDVSDVLHDTLVGSLTTAAIGNFRTTIDRTENRMDTKQVI